jgi:hypothetical protein
MGKKIFQAPVFFFFPFMLLLFKDAKGKRGEKRRLSGQKHETSKGDVRHERGRGLPARESL